MVNGFTPSQHWSYAFLCCCFCLPIFGLKAWVSSHNPNMAAWNKYILMLLCLQWEEAVLEQFRKVAANLCGGKKKHEERRGCNSQGYFKRRKGGWRKAAHAEFVSPTAKLLCEGCWEMKKRISFMDVSLAWTCLLHEHIFKRKPQCTRQQDYLKFGFLLLASDCRNRSFLFLSLERPHWRAGMGKLISSD